MNDGTLTVNSQLIVANDLDDLTGTTIQNANGTLTLAGGTTTIGSPGTPVDVILGNHASTGAGTSTAVMNLTGGSVTVNGDIKQGESGAGTIVSTLTLNGSTLDLTGHQIGADGALIGTINLLSGTLLNVTEVNAGGDISKTGSGTLNLGGTNTYTGGTTIGGGTLVFGPS